MTEIQLKAPRFDPAPYLDRIARGEAACRDLGLRIDRDGQWHYRGSPIGRQRMMKLFAGILHRLPDGSFWLVTPAEQGRVQVEDAPFVAVELRQTRRNGEPVLELRTNLDEWIELNASHPLRLRPSGTPPVEVPYLEVRDRLEARLSRPVYYELVELAEADASGTTLEVRSAGCRFPIGRLEGDQS
jgi:hypothetical protein